MNRKNKDYSAFSKGLEYLLKAPSKSVAEKVINIVFSSRNDSSSSICEEYLSELLEIDCSEAHELYTSLSECISVTLYDSAGGLQGLADLFEEKAKTVDRKLKQLIGQIINSKLDTYREASYISRVSLPQLTEVDWFVNIKRSSSEVSDMQVPTVILQLHVQEQQETTSQVPKVEKINLELSKESLDTILEGLGRIRDQLSAMN